MRKERELNIHKIRERGGEWELIEKKKFKLNCFDWKIYKYKIRE